MLEARLAPPVGGFSKAKAWRAWQNWHFQAQRGSLAFSADELCRGRVVRARDREANVERIVSREALESGQSRRVTCSVADWRQLELV